MRLWDSLTTCLVLLSAVQVSALLRSQRTGAPAEENPLEVPPVQIPLAAVSRRIKQEDSAEGRLERGLKCKKLFLLINKRKRLLTP